jgi:pyridinium-3,5-biscarboxylic acid mononucleotide sulfurtransferase
MDPRQEELAALRAASQERLARMKAIVGRHDGALVAFSAGVDSTLVLAVAHEVLGARAVALTAHSPSVPAAEREEARVLARSLGVRHLEVASHETEDPRYLANPVDRCYFCKSELYRICDVAARDEGLPVVLDGFNADDRRDHRPGHRAAHEREVISPLAEAGLTKAEVRAWSAAYGLPTWDKPQMACLASRIPYGTPITPERLARVEAAEVAVRRTGLRQIRVRDHGILGRVEVDAAELPRAFEVRQEIVRGVKAAGFQLVSLDLEPFRSGRMNEVAGIPPANGEPGVVKG